MNGGGKKKLASLSYRTPNRLAQAQEQTPGADAYPHRSDLELRVAKPREPKKFSLSAENVLASGEVGITAGSATLASLVSLDDSVLGGTAMGGGQSQGTGGTGQLGSGSGVGRGDGSSARNTHFTQVRYRETPKPPYPESARREGKEGRVLLRVLVDQEGRSKSVEVSGGSGSETLDRAAAEAIKLWRFSPARYGDKPVESWVRIPVDFRLTDVGDQ
jgi:protein TonB